MRRLFAYASTIAMAMAAMSTAAVAETFRYGSFVPERSSANSKGVFPLLAKIEAATEARIKFDKLVGGTVLSAPASLRGVRDKIVDAAFVVTQFHAADLPVASLLGELTGLGTDVYATLGALNEIYFLTCSRCRADFEKHGLKPLFVQSSVPLAISCTKSATTLSQLSGLRTSVTGAPELRWAAAIGMSARRQNFTEMVQSLQLGQSDCVIGPISWIKSYGLTDNVKSVVDAPQGVITAVAPIVFNTAALARISAADKKTLAKNMARWVYDFVYAAYIEDGDAVKKELSAKVTFSPGDEALRQKWQTYQKAEVDALINLAKSRKITDAEKLIRSFVDVYRKWHTKHLPSFAGKPDAFVEVLDREVFSKVAY